MPGTPRLLRAINDRAALRALLERGALTRPEIGALIGLSKPTTSQILARLRHAGLVVRDGIREGGPGRTAEVYRLNAAAAFAAGLDVAPARIVAAVGDLTGKVVGEDTLRTPGRSGGDVPKRVQAAVEGACRAAGVTLGQVRRIVTGVPAAIDPAAGLLKYAPHLPGWHMPNLAEHLADAVGIPVDVENDVNLAAVAERACGVAAGSSSFIVLWVSDGIGLAVVIAGQLHRGATGSAGEIGYMPVAGSVPLRDGRRPNTAGLLSLAGGPAVTKILHGSGFRGSDAVTMMREASLAVRQGRHPDRAQRASGALREVALRLATGLAAVIAVVDPELVVLAGDVALAGGEPLRAGVERELHAMTIPRPPLLLSTVGANPVLTGALELAVGAARDEIFGTAVAGSH